MFVFAILYFGIMTDAGMLDPIIDRILRAVGSKPTRIVVGTALLALLIHLDGSVAACFLVTIPAMLPLYEKLEMDRRVLACAVSLAAGATVWADNGSQFQWVKSSTTIVPRQQIRMGGGSGQRGSMCAPPPLRRHARRHTFLQSRAAV